MKIICIIIGFLFLFNIDCNPVTEYIPTTDTVIIEEVSQTTNFPIEVEVEKVSQNTTFLPEKETEEVFQTTTFLSEKEVEEVSQTTTALPEYEAEIISTETIDENKTLSDIENNGCSEKCIDKKFLNHYYAKGCQPVYHNNECESCPKGFDCNQKNNITLANNECLYNGNIFKIGESVPVRNPCQVCQCGYGFDSVISGDLTIPSTSIHCITVECPEHFSIHLHPVQGSEISPENIMTCYYTYEKEKCCAVKKECKDINELIDSNVCIYNNKTYQMGEKIYPLEDRCKTCICDENWDQNDPIGNKGCYEVKCELEIEHQLKRGCIPIYHDKACCPIDYYCHENKFSPEYERSDKCNEPSESGPCLGEFKRYYYDRENGNCVSFVYSGCGGNDNNFRDLEDCQQTCVKQNIIEEDVETYEKISEVLVNNKSDNHCVLSGEVYPIGYRLDINQKCVDCECLIPPDFTCIHRSCSPPPSFKCKVTYVPKDCCPVFDCSYEEKNIDELFDPQSCPTPMCAPDCHFETYPDRCPDCVCEQSAGEEKGITTDREFLHEVLDI